MSTRSCLLSAICAGTLVAFGVVAPTYANPNPTDQDAYPTDYPPTYPQVQSKVLDMTSNLNVIPPFLQFEFDDMRMEREANAIRAVTREMIDLQTLGDDTIRTRDLASPYTTSLAAYASYYRVTGTESPIPGLLDPAEFQREELTDRGSTAPVQPRVEPAAPMPTRKPVPALW